MRRRSGRCMRRGALVIGARSAMRFLPHAFEALAFDRVAARGCVSWVRRSIALGIAHGRSLCWFVWALLAAGALRHEDRSLRLRWWFYAVLLPLWYPLSSGPCGSLLQFFKTYRISRGGDFRKSEIASAGSKTWGNAALIVVFSTFGWFLSRKACARGPPPSACVKVSSTCV